jgi:hypothetical protein
LERKEEDGSKIPHEKILASIKKWRDLEKRQYA